MVDAGGAGLVELVRGALAALRGEPVGDAAPLGSTARCDHGRLRRAALLHGLPRGGGVPREQLERELAALGDSLVVVADGALVRAHVHTDDPGGALSAATALG